jgi:hypothetical protein
MVLQAVATAKAACGDLLIDATLVEREVRTHVPGVAPKHDEIESDCQIALTRFSSKEIDGDRIRASDYDGILFHTTTVPKENDLVRWTEGTYRIVNNRRVMAGDTVAVSQVHLRLT